VCDGVDVVDPLTDKDLPGVFSVGATVAANALTVTLNPCTVDFRSGTLNNGDVSRVRIPSTLSLTVSSNSTLGTIANVKARLAVIAINNAGTAELAIVNLAGGNNLDETTLISTTAEGGAGGADSASVIYSTSARASVAFRVVGFVDITEATPGTWATGPTAVQGAGGGATVGLLAPPTLLAEYEVTGSAVTSIQFTGLDINAHNSYRIELEWYNPAANSSISLFYNGDTTGTNYNRQELRSDGATSSSGRANTAEAFIAFSGGRVAYKGMIYVVGGYATTITMGSGQGGAAIITEQFTQQKSPATVSNITQLDFTASVASAIGVGSKIRIYRGDA
jgi:hypothetical protein